jgi:hypothetical protein
VNDRTEIKYFFSELTATSQLIEHCGIASAVCLRVVLSTLYYTTVIYIHLCNLVAHYLTMFDDVLEVLSRILENVMYLPR